MVTLWYVPKHYEPHTSWVVFAATTYRKPNDEDAQLKRDVSNLTTAASSDQSLDVKKSFEAGGDAAQGKPITLELFHSHRTV